MLCTVYNLQWPFFDSLFAFLVLVFLFPPLRGHRVRGQSVRRLDTHFAFHLGEDFEVEGEAGVGGLGACLDAEAGVDLTHALDDPLLMVVDGAIERGFEGGEGDSLAAAGASNGLFDRIEAVPDELLIFAQLSVFYPDWLPAFSPDFRVFLEYSGQRRRLAKPAGGVVVKPAAVLEKDAAEDRVHWS